MNAYFGMTDAAMTLEQTGESLSGTVSYSCYMDRELLGQWMYEAVQNLYIGEEELADYTYVVCYTYYEDVLVSERNEGEADFNTDSFETTYGPGLELVRMYTDFTTENHVEKRIELVFRSGDLDDITQSEVTAFFNDRFGMAPVTLDTTNSLIIIDLVGPEEVQSFLTAVMTADGGTVTGEITTEYDVGGESDNPFSSYFYVNESYNIYNLISAFRADYRYDGDCWVDTYVALPNVEMDSAYFGPYTDVDDEESWDVYQYQGAYRGTDWYEFQAESDISVAYVDDAELQYAFQGDRSGTMTLRFHFNRGALDVTEEDCLAYYEAMGLTASYLATDTTVSVTVSANYAPDYTLGGSDVLLQFVKSPVSNLKESVYIFDSVCSLNLLMPGYQGTVSVAMMVPENTGLVMMSSGDVTYWDEDLEEMTQNGNRYLQFNAYADDGEVVTVSAAFRQTNPLYYVIIIGAVVLVLVILLVLFLLLRRKRRAAQRLVEEMAGQPYAAPEQTGAASQAPMSEQAQTPPEQPAPPTWTDSDEPKE